MSNPGGRPGLPVVYKDLDTEEEKNASSLYNFLSTELPELVEARVVDKVRRELARRLDKFEKIEYKDEASRRTFSIQYKNPTDKIVISFCLGKDGYFNGRRFEYPNVKNCSEILGIDVTMMRKELRKESYGYFIDDIGYHHHICYDGTDVSRVHETYKSIMHGRDLSRMKQYKHPDGMFARSRRVQSEVKYFTVSRLGDILDETLRTLLKNSWDRTEESRCFLYEGKKYEFIEELTAFPEKRMRAYLKIHGGSRKIVIALRLNDNFRFEYPDVKSCAEELGISRNELEHKLDIDGYAQCKDSHANDHHFCYDGSFVSNLCNHQHPDGKTAHSRFFSYSVKYFMSCRLGEIEEFELREMIFQESEKRKPRPIFPLNGKHYSGTKYVDDNCSDLQSEDYGGVVFNWNENLNKTFSNEP
mmetsp:Transcript_18313/g.38426  ORF Transcript_18313/g.38426 Transcript_18313/m.38426 type:complete len:416 (-) Transcript_18313:300-1547(-)|eukprot:CAMPEP_0171332382 /NCGR_PEP_ID=MMETSP0878-20121228/3312_1 /TAXON_ID=67004 /ORGANISM="Thalassiosira weissflogii, Strain CCMP1336" /LENGTH=415 /DNA_ID=CAMNT_0011833093 /DNA_START=74 /DNA_END=1321 /DNA_ORIENTATION=+